MVELMSCAKSKRSSINVKDISAEEEAAEQGTRVPQQDERPRRQGCVAPQKAQGSQAPLVVIRSISNQNRENARQGRESGLFLTIV